LTNDNLDIYLVNVENIKKIGGGVLRQRVKTPSSGRMQALD
jgi:hypothetical protein